jgi:hypothetical protein
MSLTHIGKRHLPPKANKLNETARNCSCSIKLECRPSELINFALSAKPKPQETPKKEAKTSHSNCELCKEKAKERKKRPLKSEIKRCANRTESICEEAEES